MSVTWRRSKETRTTRNQVQEKSSTVSLIVFVKSVWTTPRESTKPTVSWRKPALLRSFQTTFMKEATQAKLKPLSLNVIAKTSSTRFLKESSAETP